MGAGDRLPHGYTNRTRLKGGLVEKRHRGPARHAAAAREAAVLRALDGLLPVPGVVEYDRREPLLRLAFVEGVNGQALLEKGLAGPVLGACGAFLREVAAVAVEPFGFLAPGGHLVHGDYGPHNLLLAPDAGRVVGIVDWEWARRGDPVEDLAWAEWIVRHHHADCLRALDALFAGFGREPAWQVRHGYMVDNCRRVLRRVERRGDPRAVAGWRGRLEWTLDLRA